MTLVIVSGVPGVGKTYFSQELSEKLCIPLIGKDEIKERIAEPLNVDSIEMTQKIGKISFSILYYIAIEILKRGVDCIIESHFYTNTIAAEDISRIIEQTSCSVREIVVKADFELVFNRYKARERSSIHMDKERPVDLEKQIDYVRSYQGLKLDIPKYILDNNDYTLRHWDEITNFIQK